MLATLFSMLYDEGIISTQTFFQWANSKDPVEQNGHDAAKMSVIQFLRSLKTET